MTYWRFAMANKIGVAEAKKRLSELMGRVAYKGERFIVHRRGKPMVALVPVDDLARLEEEKPVDPRGLMAAVGAFADFEEWDEIVADIYRARENARDRDINLDE
jgi:prevent-host-death family protein